MLTNLQKLLLERFEEKIETKDDEMTMLSVGMGACEFGFEEEIERYLNQNKNADLKSLREYAEQFFPKIEIES